MGDQNEGTKVLDAVIGVLAFLILVSCVIALLAFGMRTEDKFVDNMQKNIDSTEMQRLFEISKGFLGDKETVLCTAVANILSEFGEDTLLCVCIIIPPADQTAGLPSTVTIYTWDGIDVSSVSSGAQVESSTSPISAATKVLLSYSERRCKVEVLDTDQGLPYVRIVLEPAEVTTP